MTHTRIVVDYLSSPGRLSAASKDAQKLERKAKDEKAKAERDAAIAAGLSGKKKRTGTGSEGGTSI